MMAGGYPADPWTLLDSGDRTEESPAVHRRRRARENRSLSEFGGGTNFTTPRAKS